MMRYDGTTVVPGFLMHTPFFSMDYFAEVTMNWIALGAARAMSRLLAHVRHSRPGCKVPRA